MDKVLNKIKERWGVSTIPEIILVLFIFSITGFSTLYVRRLFFDWFGFTEATPFWLKTVGWLGTVLPSYQLLFLFFGFVFGKFEFVWNFEKKSFQRIKNLFYRDSDAKSENVT